MNTEVTKSAFGVVHKRTLFNPHAPKRGIKWVLHPKEMMQWDHIGLATRNVGKKPKRKKHPTKLQKIKDTVTGNLAASMKSGALDNLAMAYRGAKGI